MQPGTTLAHYHIEEKIGQGGMGEVWRARDTRLERDVALKFLPPEFAADVERLARFRNEAKLLASLSHPNIAAIHGLEESDGKTFLAMEYVAGEELAERLRRGALELDEALDLARQLAEGLEGAHERGVVHRDLKPANLKITPEGQLKILDFGLARAFSDDGAEASNLLDSPTLTAALTQQGVILGTAAYMSPEQARGRKVDERADIWAFGAILSEMLTGQRLFHGETISDTVAAVLRADLDFATLPADTPPGLRRLLARCLERDARRRLRDIGEARVRLERWRDDPDSIHEGTGPGDRPAVRPAGRRPWVPWVVAGLAVCAAAFSVWRQPSGRAPSTAVTDWVVELPGEQDIHPTSFNNVLLSPDGLWYGWMTPDGIRLRRADQRDVRLLPETADVMTACFSPDSRWIAFIGRNGLERISVSGGAPFRLAPAELSRGITWVDARTIVYSDGIVTGLKQVDVETGEIKELTQPDRDGGERSHRWPSAVPDRRAVLFECQYLGRDYDNSDVVWLDLDTGERKTVHRGGAMPLARAAGHLLFVRGGTMHALILDLGRMETRGLPIPVRENVLASVGNQEDDDGSANFALDDHGNLFYVDTMGGEDETSRLAWMSLADGRIEPFSDFAEYGPWFVVSPDGNKLVIPITRDGDRNLYVRDLATGNELLLTNRPSVEYPGAWSPDSRVFYWTQSSDDGSRFEIWSRPVDGSRPPEFVTAPPSESGVWLDSVSPDGRYLLGNCFAGGHLRDIYAVDLGTDPPVCTTILGGPDNESLPKFLGDGSYFLYGVGDNARRQLFIRRFPDTGAVWSLPAGSAGWWGFMPSERAGGVLAFDASGLYLLPVAVADDAVTIGSPRFLFDYRSQPLGRLITSWDAYPGGDRVVVQLLQSEAAATSGPSLAVVGGWERTVVRRLRETGN